MAPFLSLRPFGSPPCPAVVASSPLVSPPARHVSPIRANCIRGQGAQRSAYGRRLTALASFAAAGLSGQLWRAWCSSARLRRSGCLGGDKRERSRRRSGDSMVACSNEDAKPTDKAPEKPRKRRGPVRTLAGLVIGLGICGPATFAGGKPFALWMLSIVFLICREYSAMLDHILKPPLTPVLRWALTGICLATVLAAQLGVVTGIFECAAVSLLAALLCVQVNVKSEDGTMPIKFSHICAQVFGIFYCGYLPAFFIRLRTIKVPLEGQVSAQLDWLTRLLHWKLEPTVGACATTSCCLCIIAADTCAYVGGKRYGKRPLTTISPKKTVEGALFGLLGSTSAAVILNWAWGAPAHPLLAALVGVVIFAASLLGDLTVSAMKRDAGLKDAGALIPGHGGVLDRFDSYFFAAPACYFCWYLYVRARRSAFARSLIGAAWSGWAGGGG